MPSLRALAELVRAPAALTVPGDAVTGAAAAGVLSWRTAGLASASVLLYWAGMAGNDWADRATDALERPERPIPSGRVSARYAAGVAATLTGAGVVAAAAAGGRRALRVALPLMGTVWTYNLCAKNGPTGPGVMATCRGLDVLLGAVNGRIRDALPAALTVAAHTYTVTVLSRCEITGARPTLPATTLAGTAMVAALTAGRRRAAPAALAAWYAARYGSAQGRAAADPSALRIRTAVGAGITTLPTLQGALTARCGRPAVGLAVAASAPLASRLAKKVALT
ncbi:UbiA family prenyltransferase [Micromonospora sp. WMMA1363]|uniref:SCO3242 family prenyltransferase n=1 Tax=Micromonospora sp. WMMA1363 TaxID=3053985 RepID=UPI00259D1A9A|nr:UbiA family prenyltransferase [Micromonospora sp. WMMA1363]MDM4719666.1 UbiA family prenyltransferase [Micromonospora sp. WMMA1363]